MEREEPTLPAVRWIAWLGVGVASVENVNLIAAAVASGVRLSLHISGRDERNENKEQTHYEVQPDIAVVEDQQSNNADGDA